VRARLAALGEFTVETFDEPSSWDAPPPPNPEAARRFVAFARDLDLVMLSHGAPRIDGAILDAAPRLRFVGELEGDRFARRIDVDAAAARGVKVVDTTHGSSYPVSEWALAMMMIGLRNAGSLFRRMIAGEIITQESKRADPGFLRGELTGKRVGLIACGHIGRRLLELLKPFRCEVLVCDPHAPRLLADIFDVTLTSLDIVMSRCDVVVCLAPLMPETRRMIGARELERLQPGAVFVNVSRGAIVDPDALIARLRRGDIVACLDVFDPEPVPADSPVRTMPNVFLTPHIAGVTADCGPRFVDLMIDEMRRFLDGHETRHDLRPRFRDEA
jgi:phosphoglycerate dehydrogenase-like enzyme